jgi:hypothetical protein
VLFLFSTLFFRNKTKNAHCAKSGTLCSQFRPHHFFPKGGKKLSKNGTEASVMYKGSELQHRMDQNYKFGQNERKKDGRIT